MKSCKKCEKHGLNFHRRYSPDEFLEGKSNSKIWIIGLNPAVKDLGWNDIERGTEELSNAFDEIEKRHPYFKNFKKVSLVLYDLFGKSEGVAHTDLVKCSSSSWPPNNLKGKVANNIINNCHPYLVKQIKEHKPRMIICNGAPVSEVIKTNFNSLRKLSDTAYVALIEDHELIVVLSGFIGRIDNYARRRLGYEIEGLLKQIK